ncbi:MAG: polyribonucleotide nucleotidyltransferase [Pseudomonadota bacterium]
MVERVSAVVGGKEIIIETGKIAKQAGGSITIRMGDTIVLVTATAKTEPSENRAFLPLSVDYIEKTFAAGKIPGGFFKREGRPTQQATLTSRFIDRPIRPLFPEGYFNETQVIATVLSADTEHAPDMLAMTGASAALMLSPAPFKGPIAGVRVGRIDGKFVVNPSEEALEKSDIDIILAGSKDAVVMVEGGAKIVPEKDILDAIAFGHKEMQPLIDAQIELQKKAGKPKLADPVLEDNSEMDKKVGDLIGKDLKKAVTIPTKLERYAAIDAVAKMAVETLVTADDDADLKYKVLGSFSEYKKKLVRGMILSDGVRIDGRSLKDVRDITSETSLLPRAHGSALFTRGETQAIVTATLGTKEDQQMIDGLNGKYDKKFMLHYNFPPFSVGEVKFMRSPGRREIGHGALAERAIKEVLPDTEKFPYTIRVVSEIMESNGSSSMATVCGASLSLMDAGVPLKAPVAGIAMGLIMEGEKSAVLTDILGDEDHLGDMDFKVAGTSEGITAIQMDIKIKGLSYELLSEALEQAHGARLHILEKMSATLDKSRENLSQYAPKLTRLTIPVEKIGDLIGPGGKNIRSIIEVTGAKVDINDDGTVIVGAVDQKSGDAAVKLIMRYTLVPQVGKYYKGRVVRVADFGAFVEILPKTDGLVHISQLQNDRTNRTTDVVNVGDEVIVKILEIDRETGKIRLSRKDALGYEGKLENE